MDVIYIEGLEVDVVIGVYEWEHRVRQRLQLDIEMVWDISKAGHNDQLADTLDYSAVAERLIAVLQEKPINLIETAGEKCASVLLDEFGVSGCRLRLAKPGAVAQARNVGIVIERGVMSRG